MDTTIRNLFASKQRFAVFTNYVHIPHARFDQEPRFRPKVGSLYYDFDLTFIEDK
jgi:hypothetical protein